MVSSIKSNKFSLLFLASFSALVLASSPVRANENSAIDDVTAMVTSIGTITGVATGVVLGAMGVRLAIKQVNRLTTKG